MSQGLGTSVMTLQEATRMLQEQHAELLRKDSSRHVYVSKKFNRTFIIMAASAGRVQVQALGGCAC